MKNIYFYLLLLCTTLNYAQEEKTGFLKGTVTDSERTPIENVIVSYNEISTKTDNLGNYQIVIPAKKKVIISYKHPNFTTSYKGIRGIRSKTIRFSVKLKPKSEKAAKKTEKALKTIKNKTRNKRTDNTQKNADVQKEKLGFIKGKIKNENNKPLAGVTIKHNGKTSITDSKGYYTIEIPADKEVVINYNYLGYYTANRKALVINKQTQRFNIKLKPKSEVLDAVIVKSNEQAQRGTIKLKAKEFKKVPGANAGIENLLMTLPGVNSSNELSTQYSVRGGSFDENLVYVNGIQIYRPFLIRSGQQEGLSFLNSDMTENINFSAGGFEAKYGDRLSSVLNIHYKKPKEENSTVNINLLGGSYTYENVFAKKKLTTLIGARYRNNQLLVNTKDTETNFKPVFADIQTYLTYTLNKKNSLEFLGNLAINQYNFTPITRITRFGGLFQPRELTVNYQGNEQDDFTTVFGALSYKHKYDKNTLLDITASVFNTQEQEHYDINGVYTVAEVDPTNGTPLFVSGVGSQLNHARNDLDVLINNLKFTFNKKINAHKFEIGLKYQHENILARINEWQHVEDNGLAVRDPNLNITNQQPDALFDSPLDLFYRVNSNADIDINRITSYFQWNKKWQIKDHTFWHHFGLRNQTWHVTGGDVQSVLSPRFRLSAKPDWVNTDMVFRFATGFYHQPPSFKELRDIQGQIVPNVRAQESIHFVLSNEYSFLKWGRPFKMTTELYHKDLNLINSYTLDNVRIRYAANNISRGYATGLDFRLSGEFVPGKESWISLGFLKTEENIDNRGYIARPTDQRFKFAMLFQDYIPKYPNFKVYLNMVLNSSLPGGSPINASADENSQVDIYDFNTRLRPYRRADIGFSYIIVDQKKKYKTGFLSKFKELDFGMELFNLFDINNSTTNTWIYDVDSKRYNSVPNILTGRILNFKLGAQF